MKITLVQADIIWEKKSQNLENIGKLLSQCPSGTELVILPEMFNTGFSMNPRELCEKARSDTFQWMMDNSQKFRYAICGSYIVEEDNMYYNRWIMVTPEGKIYSYDKRHLFSPTGEDKSFTKGRKRVIIDFKGVRICPNICYDLRFPVWSRIRNDYDLLINCANWPKPRRDVWITLLKARALENQCFVAGVNRIGTDGAGIKYCGDSMIYGPKGEIMASGEQNKDCLISADISIDYLNEFREKFPVLRDGDEFTIDL